jgi:hypothetical protein
MQEICSSGSGEGPGRKQTGLLDGHVAAAPFRRCQVMLQGSLHFVLGSSLLPYQITLSHDDTGPSVRAHGVHLAPATH